PGHHKTRNDEMKKVMIALLTLSTIANHHGAEFVENFASDPALRGWQITGDASLFRGDASAENLAVTWDSSHPNSYFYRPLGTILSKDDTFALAFDLELFDVAGGFNPNKPSTFQLAIGFLNLVHATRTNFFRGNGFFSPN